MIAITRFRDDGTLTEKFRITGAEPRETIVAELMKEIALGKSPCARLDGDVLQILRGTTRPGPPGHVLTVWDDYGHRYIYRVTGYDSATDTYKLEWPD